MNGVTIDTVVSRTGSVTCRRTFPTTTYTSTPTTTAPTAVRRKSSVTPTTVTAPNDARIAVFRATSAVASLSSDSPSRIVTMPRGSPIRRATAVAATASGGATTAPIANAAGQSTPGRTRCTTSATPTVVKTTRPID